MDEEAAYARLFKQSRRTAEAAGITWRLSFSDFVDTWAPRWHERIPKRLQLSRLGYQGAYEIGNVRVDTRAAHVAEQHANRKRARAIEPVDASNEFWASATSEQITLARKALETHPMYEGLAAQSIGITVQSLRTLLKMINKC